VSEHTVLYRGRYGRGVPNQPRPKKSTVFTARVVGVQPEHKVDNIEDKINK
jgi:hypothetical protein